MSFLLVAQRALTVPGWVKNALWRAAKATPSLDLPFADSKSLVDAITGRQLISFARASSGTYTDSAGVLQTAATDVPRFDHRITSTTTNLAIRSEEFDNATWVQTGLNAFGSGSVANAIAAPDGTVTGDLIEEDTSTGFHRVSQTLISGTISTGTYTASVYVKAAQRSRAYISLDDNATGEVTAGFALLTQAFNITTAGSWSGSTASIEDVGDGWFRISLTSTKGDGSSALTLRVGIAQVSTTTISYTGNGTSGLYVWGAQLVRSDSNGQYVRTTAAAASFSTTESLGLLVEEQRTNLCLYSQAISTLVPWGANSIETCVASTLVDPAGGTSASKINLDASAASRWQQPITVVSGTTYTLSAWVRSTTGTTLFRLRFGGGVTSPDLTATTTWQRFTYTLTAGTTAGFFAFNAPSTGAATEIHVYGAQLEAGATASSYTPATTAAATRNASLADLISSAIANNIRSFYVEFSSPAVGTRGAASLNDNTANERIELITSGTDPRLVVRDGGVEQANINGGTVTAGVKTRVAVRINTNDFAISINGSTAATDTSGTLPTVDRLMIGRTQAGEYLNSRIARFAGWTELLSDVTLQSLSQP